MSNPFTEKKYSRSHFQGSFVSRHGKRILEIFHISFSECEFAFIMEHQTSRAFFHVTKVDFSITSFAIRSHKVSKHSLRHEQLFVFLCAQWDEMVTTVDKCIFHWSLIMKIIFLLKWPKSISMLSFSRWRIAEVKAYSSLNRRIYRLDMARHVGTSVEGQLIPTF